MDTVTLRALGKTHCIGAKEVRRKPLLLGQEQIYFQDPALQLREDREH